MMFALSYLSYNYCDIFLQSLIYHIPEMLIFLTCVMLEKTTLLSSEGRVPGELTRGDKVED